MPIIDSQGLYYLRPNAPIVYAILLPVLRVLTLLLCYAHSILQCMHAYCSTEKMLVYIYCDSAASEHLVQLNNELEENSLHSILVKRLRPSSFRVNSIQILRI